MTPRRLFELGLLALERVCKAEPSVAVIFVGGDVGQVEIPFHHLNSGGTARPGRPAAMPPPVKGAGRRRAAHAVLLVVALPSLLWAWYLWQQAMAKRRRLETPSIADLSRIEEQFRSETSLPSLGRGIAPIAQVAAESVRRESISPQGFEAPQTFMRTPRALLRTGQSRTSRKWQSCPHGPQRGLGSCA
ncbi:hypothetical protein [Paracoccus mutanolyticus]|uniref:hypothetical protein n=1 Tax=Paracoccus mutanolyticus TaxID=1499308 RepID=UPI0016775DD9|nr:hypothetical protein [Paracoccus mutanolyticus]